MSSKTALAGAAKRGRSKKPLAFNDDPLWFKDAVIYQVHIKSFFDANDDGVGDFQGLIDKLDYIVELGVNTLWLLPFYPSPRRDDGYDIADYKNVHPDYGTLGDAKRFIAAAHGRGLRVITELVINHTSDQHPWFQKARKAKKGSAARDFYVWSDSDQAYGGTRIIFLDTEKSNWTWDAEAGQYFWHRFFSHQPDLNFDNPAVLKAVLAVMRFWLDMGVDGLRLDAVPYLIEREGTNNENLPETHEILKRIRAEIDQHYPDRMLLAEANQWPEDTQDYFGNGDECHMAFNFPLMPRMYMAIAREDRFPITDILRQTPAIPENCQWAIFLRNHDELTLEMVTDDERDYLWSTYASDKRARINLGIRRRLAPLLERDRRRIELMNSLLLTMPGTPVMYYGDEIGMGDNIHLGDRDGVRTPMQWSMDRSGGFSKADPASLVLPPIMDPQYGFQSINVEAQSHDPHSLLNWTRRMLAVRRRYKAFGRGAIKFLYPGNRKVLAYLRQHGDETVLCVANMSRSLQAVELDMLDFDRQVPVEIMNGTPFPPIGQLPYLLTIPPYGFYAFQLCVDAAMPDWHTPAVEPMPDYQTLVLGGPLQDGPVMAHHRQVIERDVLPEYIGTRRWFGEKDRGIASTRVLYSAPWPDKGDDLVIAQVEVTLGDGGISQYALPLGIAWEDEHPPPRAQQLALARVRRGRRVGFLTDGFVLDAFASGLLRGLRQGATLDLPRGGHIHFEAGPGFNAEEFLAETDNRWLSGEQSNSSLILRDRGVLKLFRHISEGINPEIEMTRHLTAVGYANAPPLLGEVAHESGDGQRSSLAVLQGYVRNQGDAWRWTLDYLVRSYSEVREKDDPRALAEALAGYDDFARAVGKRLGELHAVLARPSDDPAFSPEPAQAAERERWARSVTDQLDRAVAALGQVHLDGRLASEREAVLARAPALRKRIDALAQSAEGALLTRAHGDFHLGQILVVQGDAWLIDFEGEPARPLAERRQKTTPLRDVAGFMRSLDYAAAVARRGEEGAPPDDDAGYAAYLQGFHQRALKTFLQAYTEVLDAAPVRWVSPQALPSLLELFLLEKAAYEINYESANRPAWLGVPIGGLIRLADAGVPDLTEHEHE